MSKVYVIQRPSFYDRKEKRWKDKYDLSAAARYGKLEYLIGYRHNIPQNTEATIKLLRTKLREFQPGDYLVAIGDPIAIAAAAIVASQIGNGTVNMLKWDRVIEGYLPYEIRVS